MPREPCAFVQVNASVDLTFCNYATSGFILTQKKQKKLTETVTQRCSVKKVFLEISQNSQENTCSRSSFLIGLQASANNFINPNLSGLFRGSFFGG